LITNVRYVRSDTRDTTRNIRTPSTLCGRDSRLVAELRIRDVPDGLHLEARREALESGRTLRQFVLDAMRAEIKRSRAERKGKR
jgi:hypothetical protein